jgi:arabinose-5-phosphate isomerase
MRETKIIEYARNIILREIKSLNLLSENIDDNFCNIINILLDCEGKVVLTGIGKSGLIAKKISATLSSTGTPSFFLHPAEAIHGDIGALDKKDIVMAISTSGESGELIQIIPTFKLLAKKLIGITAKKDSQLAKYVDNLLTIPDIEEACHLNLAPSCSSTVTLAIGDAIALTLSWLRDFKYEDFAVRHPGGLIGKKLTLKIKDLMHTGEKIPSVNLDDSFKKVIVEISGKRLGCTGVFDDTGKFYGIITDGDLRRTLESYDNISELKAKDLMTKEPKVINENERALNGLILMERFKITNLFVVNDKNEISGIIHLHDILSSGLRL